MERQEQDIVAPVQYRYELFTSELNNTSLIVELLSPAWKNSGLDPERGTGDVAPLSLWALDI